MCSKDILRVLFATVLAVGAVLRADAPAVAADLRFGSIPTLSASASKASTPSFESFSISRLTMGYLTPAYGPVTLGVLPSVGPSLVRSFDVGSSTSVPFYGARFGLFGGYGEHPSVVALTPGTSWNVGATVGYQGFYLRGGVSEVSAMGPLRGFQGVEAGFGYEIGSLDLRLSYLTSQSTRIAEHEIDSKQWSIGGIYQISPRIRLNADAFYGVGENHGAALSVIPPQSAPPGTGARVGVQLQF